MRLLIVGTLHGQLTLATKLAMEKGATVTHADGAEMALRVLRSEERAQEACRTGRSCRPGCGRAKWS